MFAPRADTETDERPSTSSPAVVETQDMLEAGNAGAGKDRCETDRARDGGRLDLPGDGGGNMDPRFKAAVTLEGFLTD